jgi:hypothetical protein
MAKNWLWKVWLHDDPDNPVEVVAESGEAAYKQVHAAYLAQHAGEVILIHGANMQAKALKEAA